MRLFFFLFLTISSGSLSLADALDDQSPTDYQSTPFWQNKFELSGTLGILNVNAQEYVYLYNRMASRLIWNTHSIPMTKLKLNYQFTPKFSLTSSFWAVIPQTNSHLTDYDWAALENPYHRTHMSSTGNTKLKANGFDINAKYWLSEPNSDAHFALMTGFQTQRYQWVAPAEGTYLEYEKTMLNDAMTGHIIGPGNSISYKQYYKTPYLGLLLGFTKNKLSMDTEFKVSRFGKVSIVDNHYLREPPMVDIEKPSKKPKYFNVNMNIGYALKPKLSLYSELGLLYVPESYADRSITLIGYPEEDIKFAKGAGFRILSKSIALGLKYQF